MWEFFPLTGAISPASPSQGRSSSGCRRYSKIRHSPSPVAALTGKMSSQPHNRSQAAARRPGIRPVNLGDDADDGTIGAGRYIGRKKAVILRRAHQQAHHVRLIGIEGQSAAQGLGFGIFSRRIDDHVVMVDILCLVIVDGFAPQRLGEGGLAAAHRP